MANTKYKYAAQLEAVHSQWCVDNGYPVREATSHKRDATLGCIASKSTYKPQATSNKLTHKQQANSQATSLKRQAER